MAEPDAPERPDRLYLDDFHVGQRFTSATHRIDTEEIKAFARQFDPQPFHLDEEAAKSSMFGGLVASGWHTAAISMRLQVESGLPIAGGMIGIGRRDELAAADAAGRRPARGERDQGGDAIALAPGPRRGAGAQRNAQSA